VAHAPSLYRHRPADNARDPLACLAALALLQEAAERCGGGAAVGLARLAMPRLLALASDALLTSGVLPLAAGLLAKQLEAAGGCGAEELDAGGAHPLVALLARALESDETGVEGEATVLDAAGTLCTPAAGAEMVAAPPAPLLRGAAERALGRAPAPGVRIAALHCLAGIAGLERAGATQRREDALLSKPVRAREGVRG